MKSLIFMCLSLVIMAGIARVYMAGGLDGLLGPNSGSEKFKTNAPKNVKAVTTDRDIQVYKWRDEKGVMHFDGTRPAQTTGVEEIQLKTNQNVMQATAVSKEEEMSKTEVQPVTANPYSPQGMSDMLKQTRALTDSLNKQQAERQKMLQGINQ